MNIWKVSEILKLANLIKEAHSNKQAVVLSKNNLMTVAEKVFEDDYIIADFTPNDFDLFPELPSVLTDSDIANYIANFYDNKGGEINE